MRPIALRMPSSVVNFIENCGRAIWPGCAALRVRCVFRRGQTRAVTHDEVVAQHAAVWVERNDDLERLSKLVRAQLQECPGRGQLLCCEEAGARLAQVAAVVEHLLRVLVEVVENGLLGHAHLQVLKSSGRQERRRLSQQLAWTVDKRRSFAPFRMMQHSHFTCCQSMVSSSGLRMLTW